MTELLNKLNAEQRNDSCYKSACYLLACGPDIKRAAAPLISTDGINFARLRKAYMPYDAQKMVIEAAYSLFSYKPGKASPYEISNLPGNYLTCVLNAILIKSGRVQAAGGQNEA